MSPRHRTRSSLALLGALSAGPAGAQVVRGVVTDSATGRPLSDATVALVGTRGPVAAAVTDSTGAYTVGAAAGRYRLELRRIGYRVVSVAEFAIGEGETQRRNVVMAATPLRLAAVRSDARSRCVVNPEQGSAAAMLWSEVLKALDATALMQRAGAARLTVRDFARELDPRTREVRDEHRAERSGVSASPYASPHPDSLAARGYVQDRDGTTWYYAPTADALTSTSFAATHCIEVTERRPPSPGLVGIRFEPVAGRGHPDVRGTIWIDLTSAELRRVDYEYTDLPGLDGVRDFGGQVDFARLPGAGWVVKSWLIRAPRMGFIERSQLMPGAGGGVNGMRVSTRRELGVLAIREVGGEVAQATPRVGVTRGDSGWSVGVGRVQGVLVDSLTRLPIAGALVTVEETARTSVSGADGRFVIDSVLAGTQSVTFTHPAAVGLRRQRARVEVAPNGVTPIDLSLPSAARTIAELCPSQSASSDSGMIYGVVRLRGTAVAGATVAVSWNGFERSGVDRIQAKPLTVRAATDGEGVYRLCGVPAAIALRVRVEERRRLGPSLDVVLRSPLVARVDVDAGVPRLVRRDELLNPR